MLSFSFSLDTGGEPATKTPEEISPHLGVAPRRGGLAQRPRHEVDHLAVAVDLDLALYPVVAELLEREHLDRLDVLLLGVEDRQLVVERLQLLEQLLVLLLGLAEPL